MTIDEAIKHCLEIAEEAEVYKPEVNAPILSDFELKDVFDTKRYEK